jgi:hypothetical protein
MDYDSTAEPTYLIASICCYLANFAAASYMNKEAIDLASITNSFLSICPPTNETSVLKRGCTLAILTTQDSDNEEIYIPNYLQNRLIEGYKYSSGQSSIPSELRRIVQNPVTIETMPDYLYFVDKIWECYEVYNNAKTNIAEQGKQLAHLLISMTVRSYKITILRELGFRGRQLKNIAGELSALTTHRLFPFVSPILLCTISKCWRCHIEAIEEMEEDHRNGININITEFVYFHDMINQDLRAANILGKRFSKVYNAFGGIVQRMIDCSKRKSLISNVKSLNLSLDLSVFSDQLLI